MNEIVWPDTRSDPSVQVVVGRTAGDVVPPFMVGCSLRTSEAIIEIKGKRARGARGQFVKATA